MAVVIGGITKGKYVLDYRFIFEIKKENNLALEKDVFSGIYRRHNPYSSDDLWQLELKRAVGNNDSQLEFNAKLRLISSPSKWKIVQLGDYSKVTWNVPTSDMPVVFKSGDEFNIGTISTDQRVDVEVLLCYNEARPSAKRVIQVAESTLSSEVNKWFQSEDFGDFTIVAKDGMKFRCHRDLLARRSQVLSLMLNCPMSEAIKNVINVKNFDGEIVASLLSFIYTDECGDIGPIADGLYAAAHQYELDRLKFLCQSALAANITKDNVVRTKTLAELYHLDILQAKCVGLEGSDAKRLQYAEPKGISIFSDHDFEDLDLNPLDVPELTDYKFDFAIYNCQELEVGTVVLSNIFAHKNGDRWQLELFKAGDDWFSCDLHLVDTKNEELKIAYVMWVDAKETVDEDTTWMGVFQHSGDTVDLGQVSVGSSYDGLKLEVQLVKYQYAQSPADPEPPKLTILLLEWIQAETFGDTIVVAADGQRFRCHRDVFVRRSEVFRLKFDGRMREENEIVVVEIEDFEGEIVTAMMQFLYTDECGNIGPIASRLYLAACRYQLDRLKLLCESALAASLSSDTFVKIYRMTKDYHLDQLLAVCVDYLDVHKAELPVGKLFLEATSEKN